MAEKKTRAVSTRAFLVAQLRELAKSGTTDEIRMQAIIKLTQLEGITLSKEQK